MSDGAIGAGFRDESRRLLDSYFRRIAESTRGLDAEQLWWRPHEGANSVANLLLHLEGNLSQWVLEGLAGEPYERHRDGEFAAREAATGEALRGRLGRVIERCLAAVAALDDAQLRASLRIQGYDVTGLAALYHAVEHASYHTGQIVALSKQLLGPASGIDFYPQHRGE
jgi:uncharacterized damage-inducible protein DinB